MTEAQAFREIDRIVDRVIDNPRKAAKLKEALHSKPLVDRTSWSGAVRMRSSYDDTVDDLWDNVPV